MKPNILICLGFIFLLASCSQTDDFNHNASTDSFILVDYFNGVYKFVQINNDYTIGVDEGILNIPADFMPVFSEDVCLYYQVDLKFSNFSDSDFQIVYQRFCEESSLEVKNISTFQKIKCSVAKIPLEYGDYLYNIILD